jgi:hypothetical protein
MWVGLELKPDFFIYLVKPGPKFDLSLTYFVKFSSPKEPEPEIWSLSLTPDQKNQARPTSILVYHLTPVLGTLCYNSAITFLQGKGQQYDPPYLFDIMSFSTFWISGNWNSTWQRSGINFTHKKKLSTERFALSFLATIIQLPNHHEPHTCTENFGKTAFLPKKQMDWRISSLGI